MTTAGSSPSPGGEGFFEHFFPADNYIDREKGVADVAGSIGEAFDPVTDQEKAEHMLFDEAGADPAYAELRQRARWAREVAHMDDPTDQQAWPEEAHAAWERYTEISPQRALLTTLEMGWASQFSRESHHPLAPGGYLWPAIGAAGGLDLAHELQGEEAPTEPLTPSEVSELTSLLDRAASGQLARGPSDTAAEAEWLRARTLLDSATEGQQPCMPCEGEVQLGWRRGVTRAIAGLIICRPHLERVLFGRITPPPYPMGNYVA